MFRIVVGSPGAIPLAIETPTLDIEQREGRFAIFTDPEWAEIFRKAMEQRGAQGIMREFLEAWPEFAPIPEVPPPVDPNSMPRRIVINTDQPKP